MKQISAIIIIIFFYACNTKTPAPAGNDIIVSVGSHILTKKALEEATPEVLNPDDSLIVAENFIENWVKENLIYDLAKENINNIDEINQLVENYRKSLMIYQYKEQLINQKMSAETSENEMKKYYEENSDKFKLENTIIKGLFLKIPADAPEINKIKEWYKSPSIKDIENIEKYSFQNAVNYDYFYDRWVKLDEVVRLFPLPWADPAALVRQQKQVEVQDSTFCYLLNIKEVLYPGDKAPYEYIKPNVREMIINQKRLDFLRKFEDDLYKIAVDKGQIKRTKN